MFMEGALVHDKSVIDDELVNERHALMLMQNPQVVKTMVVPNMTARLSEIKCPSLGFWGINEKMMPETGILKLAKGMPNLRMVTVPNCGPWVMVEHTRKRDVWGKRVSAREDSGGWRQIK